MQVYKQANADGKGIPSDGAFAFVGTTSAEEIKQRFTLIDSYEHKSKNKMITTVVTSLVLVALFLSS